MKWAKGTDEPPPPPRITNPQTEETPVDIRVGSYSEIDTARQCPHKHLLSYRKRWVSPREAPALKRGTRWHWVMETWYEALKTGRDLDEVQHEIADFLKVIPEEEEKELLEWMWNGYREVYGEDKGWEILSVEDKYEVLLPKRDIDGPDFKIKLKIDLVIKVRMGGDIAVVDHKTARNMPSDKEEAIDDQFGLYLWGLRELGIKAKYGIRSVARTQKNKSKPQTMEERFKRTRMHRTQRELDQLAHEAYKTLHAMYVTGLDYRSPNIETCRFRCDYLEACLAGRKGIGEDKLLLASGFVQDYTRH